MHYHLHRFPEAVIIPHLSFSPAFPDGCVVKSSGLPWMMTVFPMTSDNENRSDRNTENAHP